MESAAVLALARFLLRTMQVTPIATAIKNSAITMQAGAAISMMRSVRGEIFGAFAAGAGAGAGAGPGAGDGDGGVGTGGVGAGGPGVGAGGVGVGGVGVGGVGVGGVGVGGVGVGVGVVHSPFLACEGQFSHVHSNRPSQHFPVFAGPCVGPH